MSSSRDREQKEATQGWHHLVRHRFLSGALARAWSLLPLDYETRRLEARLRVTPFALYDHPWVGLVIQVKFQVTIGNSVYPSGCVQRLY